MLRWPKALLEDTRVDPSTNDNYPIRIASEKGHTEIVRMLLEDPRVDPSADDNEAIQNASNSGYIEMVRLCFAGQRPY